MAGDRETAVQDFSALILRGAKIRALPGGVVDFVDGFTISDNKNIVVNTSTGTQIATGATQKLGFRGTTAAVQPSAIADPASDTAANNAAIDSILAALRTIGIIAT